MIEPKILLLALTVAVIVSILLMLTGCMTPELRVPIGPRGTYGEIYASAGYRLPNLDDPTESPAWLYPDFKGTVR